MDGTARHSDNRHRVTGGTPLLECRDCRMPVLLTSVLREGPRRWIDCPYCDRHDEWTVEEDS